MIPIVAYKVNSSNCFGNLHSNFQPTVHHRLTLLNRHVGAVRHWAAVRYSASLLKQMVDSLSPYVTQILVNGKMVREMINDYKETTVVTKHLMLCINICYMFCRPTGRYCVANLQPIENQNL